MSSIRNTDSVEPSGNIQEGVYSDLSRYLTSSLRSARRRCISPIAKKRYVNVAAVVPRAWNSDRPWTAVILGYNSSQYGSILESLIRRIAPSVTDVRPQLKTFLYTPEMTAIRCTVLVLSEQFSDPVYWIIF